MKRGDFFIGGIFMDIGFLIFICVLTAAGVAELLLSLYELRKCRIVVPIFRGMKLDDDFVSAVLSLADPRRKHIAVHIINISADSDEIIRCEELAAKHDFIHLHHF